MKRTSLRKKSKKQIERDKECSKVKAERQEYLRELYFLCGYGIMGRQGGALCQ